MRPVNDTTPHEAAIIARATAAVMNFILFMMCWFYLKKRLTLRANLPFLFHITAVVPAMGTEFAFRKADGIYKVIQPLEFQCGKLKVLAHCVNHLLVLFAVGIDILLQYLFRKVLGSLKVSDDSSCVQVK